MFLKLKPFQAFSRFEFKDPDTRMLHKAPDLSNLYNLIIRYRAQNNLPPLEALNHVVENYLCSLPENCYKCQENEEVDRKFSAYIRGGVALLKNMFFRRFASQEVAETRAAQCVKCPYNVFPDKGPFLQWADDIAIAQVGDRKVSVTDKLGNCAVCSCVIKSKVFYDGKLDKFPDDQLVKMKSVSCWQLPLAGQ